MSEKEKLSPESVAQIELIDMQLRRPDTVSPWCLSGVNWRVSEGDFWAVGGLHWTGKSNLLNTAAAINARSRGRLDLFGKNTAEMDEEELLAERLRIGMVFEGDGRLFPQLTVSENIALPLRYRTGRDQGLRMSETKDFFEKTNIPPGSLAFCAHASLAFIMAQDV